LLLQLEQACGLCGIAEMSRRERNWRPILLSIEDIEYDLRIGATKFYEWMAKGWMPQPWVKQGGVTRWLASQVLDAIENFPNRGELEAERRQRSTDLLDQRGAANPWADQRAK